MRYCFNLGNSLIASVGTAVSVIGAIEDFVRRRFGVTSSGTAVTYNFLGEPTNLNGDIYQDLSFQGSIRKQRLVQQGTEVGGMPSDKERLEVFIDPTLDIQKGDLIQRLPISNQQWFKVSEIVQTEGGVFTYLIAFSEIRSTR